MVHQLAERGTAEKRRRIVEVATCGYYIELVCLDPPDGDVQPHITEKNVRQSRGLADSERLVNRRPPKIRFDQQRSRTLLHHGERQVCGDSALSVLWHRARDRDDLRMHRSRESEIGCKRSERLDPGKASSSFLGRDVQMRDESEYRKAGRALHVFAATH